MYDYFGVILARHVVEEKRDIKRAMEFLHECDLLNIEDILPFFPDFVTIDHFKVSRFYYFHIFLVWFCFINISTLLINHTLKNCITIFKFSTNVLLIHCFKLVQNFISFNLLCLKFV